MKRIRRTVLSILIGMLLLGVQLNIVKASSYWLATPMFCDYWTEALNEIDTLCVYTEQGDEISDEIVLLYRQSGINAVYDYLVRQQCYITYNEKDENIENTKLGARANKTVTVSERSYFTYHCPETDELREWTMLLKGSYVYTVGTDEIVSAQKPTLSIAEADFGEDYAAVLDSVSTNSTINTSTNSVTFSASYRMKAFFQQSIGDYPFGTVFDYGTYRMSFSARP